MLYPGANRSRVARTLHAAYGDGLLSETTLAHRLEELFGNRLIDPGRLTGDLNLRAPAVGALRRGLTRALAARDRVLGALDARERAVPTLLALDWSGVEEQLLIGRHQDCDVVLTHATVSRRHAQLRFRDGGWVLQDLTSTNGTVVNGVSVVRCRLEVGDVLRVGEERLLVD